MAVDIQGEVVQDQEFRCAEGRFDICGRLVVERERYAQLEEELERTRQDLDKYRQFFSTLLKKVGTQLNLSIIPEIFKHNISQISQVKSTYLFQRRNILSFWIFLEGENWEVEDQIYDTYGELLSMFPDFDIRLRLLRLWGRKPEDLLPTGGDKIFG